MPNLFLQSADLSLETRRKTAVRHHMTRQPPLAGAYQEDRDNDRKHPNAKRRNVGPCNTYNCHGLTFGSRRAEVAFADVEIVLEEDDYTEIDRNSVMAGDIAVYFSTGQKGSAIGDIEHSGVVVECTQLAGLKNIKIVSKWGYGDERVHFLSDCPYDVGNVRFFRINDCPRFAQHRPFSRSKRSDGGQFPPVSSTQATRRPSNRRYRKKSPRQNTLQLALPLT